MTSSPNMHGYSLGQVFINNYSAKHIVNVILLKRRTNPYYALKGFTHYTTPILTNQKFDFNAFKTLDNLDNCLNKTYKYYFKIFYCILIGAYS